MPDERTTDAQPADKPWEKESREALREEARTLRLWADHLESQLARKAKQVDVWRHRAEEREARIRELESPSGRRRKQAKRRTRSTPNAPESRDLTQHPQPTSRTATSIVLPTIRAAVIAIPQTNLPRILHRMNTTTVTDESGLDTLSRSDVLVLIGQEGHDLAMGWDKSRQWIERSHPVVGIGTARQAISNIDEAELNYYDEADDVFAVALSSPSKPLQPTLERLDSLRSDWAREIVKTIEDLPTPEDRERRAVLELRRLRSGHSSRAVAEKLISLAGVTVPPWRSEALAILQSRRPGFVLEAVSRLAAQTYRPIRIAVGLHPQAWDAEAEIGSLLEPAGIPFQVVRYDSDFPQGSCLNNLVAMSPGDVVLKIDDDDLYSSVYVEDMMGALAYSGGDIVGKAASFFRLRNGEHVLIAGGKSYQKADHVVGPTITATRAAWDAVRFPARHQRVDSKFLQAARAVGLSVVSHHPWDFCVIRHHEGNTWTASDNYFRSIGKPVDLEWEQMETSRDAS